MAELIALSSDSDEEMDTLVLLYLTSKRQKSVWKSGYIKMGKTHGGFALTSEFSDKQFTNYFRLNRSQFNEVHRIMQNSIYSEGCNAQKPNGTEEKLAVFLRKVFLFLYLNCLQKHYSPCYPISSMALIFAKFYLSKINAYRYVLNTMDLLMRFKWIFLFIYSHLPT